MIKYYSANFGVLDLVNSLLCTQSERKVERYFQQLTGKKYVLLTSSCRSALFLAYQSIGIKGVVHTTPLTCNVAIKPITASGNVAKFHDVNVHDWTIDPDSIPSSVTPESVAVQAIHLGGFLCDMPALRKICSYHNLVLIEDCAQGFCSIQNGVPAGVYGDIACFTLCKNAFGLGGGILATDNLQWYNRAKEIQCTFPNESSLKVINRVVETLLDSLRLGAVTDNIILLLAHARKSYSQSKFQGEAGVVNKELRKPCKLYSKAFAARINKIEALNKKRRIVAKQMMDLLSTHGYRFQSNENSVSSYTKLFCTHDGIYSPKSIKSLNKEGIEAKHLEHKFGVYYQPRLLDLQPLRSSEPDLFPVYDFVHDKLVGLPLFESMSSKEMRKIESKAEKIIQVDG